MILQALCDYYDRKEADLPPYGFEEKAIPFIIVIDQTGKFIQLEKNSILEDGKSIVNIQRVPKASGRSGAKSYATAYCLWDHYGYIVAQPKVLKPDDIPKDKEIETAQKQHESFKTLITQLHHDLPNDKGVKAVELFLNSEHEKHQLKNAELWNDCLKIKGCNLTFRLALEPALVCQSEEVINWVKQQPLSANDAKEGFCLITGEKSNIVRLHDNVSGVSQKPAPLASINEPAYTSYNKEKGFNFPVSAQASFKYATALNHLLRKTSATKFRLAEASYVCWSEKENLLEQLLPFMFTDDKDNPDKGANAIKSLFSTIHNGAYQDQDGQKQTKFYVLGLTPNVARISIRYWNIGTIASFSENLAQWFNDLEITGRDHYGYPPLIKLLRASVLQYKDANIPPNLPADIIRCILSGSRLPETLIQMVIRRIKAEQGDVSYHRVCSIKAYLNRKYRLSNQNLSKPSQEKLTVALNKEEKRQGYCLGRLFAMLEKLQLDAQKGIKATIRDRYYSSASSTPKTVFGTLMRLSTHHLKKLENPAFKVNAEKSIGEVMDLISEFPAHLNMEHQGLFAVGYYHQKQDFYKKKTPNLGEEE